MLWRRFHKLLDEVCCAGKCKFTMMVGVCWGVVGKVQSAESRADDKCFWRMSSSKAQKVELMSNVVAYERFNGMLLVERVATGFRGVGIQMVRMAFGRVEWLFGKLATRRQLIACHADIWRCGMIGECFRVSWHVFVGY